MTKLKPCPFCGGTDIDKYQPTIYEIGNDASVKCANPICGAEVCGSNLKIAVAKWNRRISDGKTL